MRSTAPSRSRSRFVRTSSKFQKGAAAHTVQSASLTINGRKLPFARATSSKAFPKVSNKLREQSALPHVLLPKLAQVKNITSAHARGPDNAERGDTVSSQHDIIVANVEDTASFLGLPKIYHHYEVRALSKARFWRVTDRQMHVLAVVGSTSSS